MLSCQHEKDVTEGKKRVLLNPTPELKREHETCTFEEGEVYGMDILVVTGTDGKVRKSICSSPALGRLTSPRPNPTPPGRRSTNAQTTSTTS